MRIEGRPAARSGRPRVAVPRISLALLSAAALLGCATGPATGPGPGSAQGAELRTGTANNPGGAAAAASAARREAGSALPSAGRQTPVVDPLVELGRRYLEASLSRLARTRAESGSAVAVLGLPGRGRAALRVSISRARAADGYARSRVEALALSAMAGGKGLAATIEGSGASVALDAEGGNEVALSLSCGSDTLEAVALAIATGLSSPLADRDAFATSRRKLALEELRRSGDPIALAVEAGARSTGPSAEEATRLDRATIEEASEALAAALAEGRLSLVAVGDIDPPVLAGLLKASLDSNTPVGQERASGSPPSAPGATATPVSLGSGKIASEPLSALPGAATLRAVFPGTGTGGMAARRRDDQGPTILALAMLEDILEPRIRAEFGPGASARVEPPELPGADSAVVLRGLSDPRAAGAAVEEALGVLASGSCAPARPGEGPSPIASRLRRYQERSLVEWYARSDSAAIAARVSGSLSAGGDGDDYFRAALLVAKAGPEDVARAARALLAGGGAAWLALGDPAILAGIGDGRLEGATPASGEAGIPEAPEGAD